MKGAKCYGCCDLHLEHYDVANYLYYDHAVAFNALLICFLAVSFAVMTAQRVLCLICYVQKVA